MRFRLILSCLAALLLAITPQKVEAQGGCLVDCPPNTPPVVSISPLNSTHVSTPSFTFTVSISDDGSLDPGTVTGTTSLGGTWGTNYAWGILTGTVTLNPGANTIFAKIADTQGLYGADTVTIYYDTLPTPPATAAATLSLAPYSNSLRRVAGCSGCIYGTYSYSTPAYISRNKARSVTLMYSSSLAQPRILVQLDANFHTTTVPDHISMRLDSASTALALTNGGNEAWYSGDTGTVRVGVQRDASSYQTGWYDHTAEVRGWWSGTPYSATQRIRTFVINERSSYVGAGWSIQGLQRLWPQGDSVAISDGSGGIAFFARTGSTTFATSDGDFTTLTVTGCPSSCVYTRSSPNGMTARFDASGFLTTVKNRFGDSTVYAYSSSKLTSITDEAGQATTFAYAPNGSCLSGVTSGTLCMITTPGGRTSKLVVNDSNDLVQIQDPDGVTAFTGTYSGHLLGAATDRLNATTAFGYDAFTDLASFTMPGVTVTDTSGATTTATSTINYSPIEYRLLATNNSSSSTSRTRVRADEAYVTITTPNGTVTGLILQGAGEPTRTLVNPLAGYVQVTNTTYDSNYLPTSATTTPVGGTTTYMWSGDELLSTTDPNGAVNGFSYAAFEQHALSWITTPHGANPLIWGDSTQQANYYSGTYATLDSTIAGTSKTTFTWDGHGRVIGTSDRQSHTTATSYESGGFQNTSDSWVGSSHSVFTHDHYGRDSTITDPNGNVTTLAYDLLNRQTSVIQPGSATTTTSYSENTTAHTLTATLTDPRSVVFTTVTNALGLQISATDPQSHSSTVGYDVNGAMTRVVDRAGGVMTFLYDSLGRIVKRSAGSNVATYSYDNNNGPTQAHFTAVSYPEGTDTLVTDANGRQASYVGTRGTLSIASGATYDDYGNRSTLSVTSGSYGTATMNFGYNSLQRPALLPDWSGHETGVRYTNEQLLDTLRFPTGADSLHRLTVHPSGYDHFGHPSLITMYIGSTPVQQTSYAYDALGRVKGITNGPDNNYTRRSFNYDARGRLAAWADTLFTADSTQEACPDNQIICDPAPPWDVTSSATQVSGHAAVYSPDQSGNRTDGSASLTHDRVTSMTGADGRAYSISYDSAGHITEKAVSGGYTQKYTWNTLGQLAWVNTNGDSVNYGYDTEGHRVRKTHNGIKTYYLWDGDNMVAEVDSTGTPHYMYSYQGGLDQPLSVTIPGSATYYYQLDELGNVVALWNTSNSEIEGYDYDPYGYAITTTGSVTQPLRWKGAQLDSTGLYYMRARYYDPALGRFLSEDPTGLAGGINPYVFADGEPVNHVDPQGLGACSNGYVAITTIDSEGGVHKSCKRAIHIVSSPNSNVEFANWLRNSLEADAEIVANLDEQIRASTWQLIADSFEIGHLVQLTSGLRSFEQQAAIYAQGRTTPGDIISNALPGSSFHNYGDAFDVAFASPSGLSWSGPWSTIGAIGQQDGLTWGGGFSHFVDNPHFQIPGVTIGTLQGLYPHGR